MSRPSDRRGLLPRPDRDLGALRGILGRADSVDLDESTCWSLLSGSSFGRIALRSGEGVEIFPVNHLVRDGAIYFRSAPGEKLRLLTGGVAVAFEADGVVDRDRWSVVVHGTARRLDVDTEIEASGVLGLRPDFPRDRMWNYVRITPDRLTGRAFRARTAREEADRESSRRVREALDASDDVDAVDLDVTVVDGCAILTGRARNHADRLAARGIAGSAPGIVAVSDEIECDLPRYARLADGAIANHAEQRLAGLGLTGIRVSVRQHRATMSGRAGSSDERRTAHHAVATTPGVHFVSDDVDVDPVSSAGARLGRSEPTRIERTPS